MLAEDGTYVLEVPYADPRELIMDILRHVPEVEVVGPEGLKAELVRKLRAGLQTMGPGSSREPDAHENPHDRANSDATARSETCRDAI